MKNSICCLAVITLLVFTAKAQTKNTIAENHESVEIPAEKKTTAITKNDEICYRSDSEVHYISKRKVPAQVKEAFYAKYKNTKNVQWRLDLNAFAADFKNEDKQYVSAYFKPDGEFTEAIILKKPDQIDAFLMQHIQTQFMDSKVVEVMEVQRPGTNEVFYVVNISRDGSTSQHYVDSSGDIIDL